MIMDKIDIQNYWKVWGKKGEHRSHMSGKRAKRVKRKFNLPSDLMRLVR